MKKQLLPLLGLLCCVSSGFAQESWTETQQADGTIYTLTVDTDADGNTVRTAALTGFDNTVNQHNTTGLFNNGYPIALAIPDYITGQSDNAIYFVTSVDYAFKNWTQLTAVTISDRVKSIKNECFLKCSSLRSVTLFGGLEAIPNRAFQECSSLTTIAIPNSVKAIGDNAFSDCTSLTSVSLPEGLETIGETAFDNCDLRSVVVPSTVDFDATGIISNGIFRRNTNLTSVTFKGRVRKLWPLMFGGCTSLNTITFENSTPPEYVATSPSGVFGDALTVQNGGFVTTPGPTVSSIIFNVPVGTKTAYATALAGSGVSASQIHDGTTDYAGFASQFYKEVAPSLTTGTRNAVANWFNTWTSGTIEGINGNVTIVSKNSSSVVTNNMSLSSTYYQAACGSASPYFSSFNIACSDPDWYVVGYSFTAELADALTGTNPTLTLRTCDSQSFNIVYGTPQQVTVSGLLETVPAKFELDGNVGGSNKAVNLKDFKVYLAPKSNNWFVITTNSTTAQYANLFVQNFENEYFQEASKNYAFGLTTSLYENKPATAFVRIVDGATAGTKYVQSVDGHYVRANCLTARNPTDRLQVGTITTDATSYFVGTNNNYVVSSSVTSAGAASGFRWNYFSIAAVGSIVGGSSSTANISVSLHPTHATAFDAWTVEIVNADQGTEVMYDPRVELTAEKNLGIAKVYNNGTFFVEKGTELTPDDFTAYGVTNADGECEETDAKISINNEDKIITFDYRGYTDEINHYKVLGNDLVSTPLVASGSDAETAWTAIASSTRTNQAAYEAIEEAYFALLDAMDGTHANFAPFKVQGDRMVCNDGTNVGRYGTDVNTNKTTWTLQKSGEGFKLINEYYQRYLRHPQHGESGFGAATLTDEEHASVYVFDVYDAATEFYGIRTLDAEIVEYSATNTDAAGGAAQDYRYLHSNMTQNFQAWGHGENSSWKIQTVDGMTAAHEHLVGAIDHYTVPVGTTVSHAQSGDASVDAAYAAAYAAAINQRDHATDEVAVRAAATALKVAYLAGTWVTNTPAVGRYYRLKGAHNNNYLTSNVDATSNVPKLTTTDNGLESVFLWDGHNFVSFATGLVLADCSGSNKIFALKTETGKVCDVSIEKCTNTLGAYWFHTKTGTNNSNNIFIYNANSELNLDRGGIASGSTPTDAGYEWVMEEVDWLPVPIGENVGDLTTIYSPEELGLGYDGPRVDAYVLDFDGKRVTKLANHIIPANTPVLLSYKGERENGCVYLPVRHSAESAEYEGNLSGTYFTMAANGAYGLGNGDFVKSTESSAQIAGFTVYLAADAENATAGLYEIGLPTHGTGCDISLSNNTLTITHADGYSLSKLEHDLQITIEKVTTGSEPTSAPMRRIAGDNGSYSLGHADVAINEETGAATIDITSIPDGTYDVTIPAEFFLLGGTHYSPEISAQIIKDVNTGVFEISIEEGSVSAVYDLQGRRLSKAVKGGVNIINGRKVFIAR